MVVSINMVALRAAQLSEQFRLKSRDAQYHSARRLVHSQGLVFLLGTNESQRSPAEEVVVEAMDYIQNVARPKVSPQEGGRHEDFILNMDQTPIPFTYNSKKPLKLLEGVLCTFESQQTTLNAPHLPWPSLLLARCSPSHCLF